MGSYAIWIISETTCRGFTDSDNFKYFPYKLFGCNPFEISVRSIMLVWNCDLWCLKNRTTVIEIVQHQHYCFLHVHFRKIFKVPEINLSLWCIVKKVLSVKELTIPKFSKLLFIKKAFQFLCPKVFKNLKQKNWFNFSQYLALLQWLSIVRQTF